MPHCFQCNSNVQFPCAGADLPGLKRGAIVMASNTQLGKVSYFRRLAMATRSQMERAGMSRRQFPDWLADVIYGYDGPILWSNGSHFYATDTLIDDAFNNDGSFRWLSDFVTFAEREPRQSPQVRVLTRLRVISLAFQIDQPNIARHFCR